MDLEIRDKKKSGFGPIWIAIFVVVIIAGLCRGNIKFKLGRLDESDKIKEERITLLTANNLDNIKNITGEIRSSPGSWNKFSNLLKKTKSNLKIQTYDFTENNLKQIIKNLANKSADIQIIMEDKKFQQFKDTFKALKDYYVGYMNVQIKSDQQMGTEYVHSKINIIDTGFIIQTANLTNSSFNSNREYFFYSQDTGVWASLNTIFDKDREGNQIKSSDIHPNLVVCNINCRSMIEHLLANAEQSITIQTQYITDTRILNILKRKIASLGTGKVQIVLADTDDNHYAIYYLGTDRAKLLKKPYNHTKMILVDDKILLLGSMNLSENSLDKNREIGILLADPDLISQFTGQFQKDWKISK